MTPPLRRRGRSLLALIALAAVACGGGSGPTGGGGTVVLTGTWDAVHVFTVGPQTLATCGGQLVVGSQTGGSFSGQISIPADGGCAGLAGQGTVSGTVSGSRVTLTVQGLGLDDLLETIDCARISSTGFTGTASEESLVATETQTFRCDDPDLGQVTIPIQWRISAERAGT